jgi:mannose/fructose/N-acetylgalactosamine-specific phosphotransferase system component IIB
VRVLLYRVDDRLIHGQVVLAWGRRLQPDRIVVVDDRIACDSWERELLAAAAAPEAPAAFLSVREAAGLAESREAGSAIVLMESPRCALRLADAGLAIPELNLGGLHREGGIQVTSYLFLAPDDFRDLRELASRGTKIYAQDVPEGRRVPSGSFLEAVV